MGLLQRKLAAVVTEPHARLPELEKPPGLGGRGAATHLPPTGEASQQVCELRPQLGHHPDLPGVKTLLQLLPPPYTKSHPKCRWWPRWETLWERELGWGEVVVEASQVDLSQSHHNT